MNKAIKNRKELMNRVKAKRIENEYSARYSPQLVKTLLNASDVLEHYDNDLIVQEILEEIRQVMKLIKQ